MSESYALLQSDGRLLFATRQGSGWQVGETPSDIGPAGRRLTVFVDGRDVLTQWVAIPSRAEAEIRRAAPFAIEDELAVAVEDAHIAISAAGSDRPQYRQISVVSDEKMTDWLQRLSDIGLGDAQLLPVHAVIPDNNQIFAFRDLVLGRIGDRAFSLDSSIGNDVLASLLTGSEVAVYGHDLAAGLSCEAAGEGVRDETEFLIRLANWACKSRPAGLRQGRFAVRRQVELTGLYQWRRSGILAAALGLIWLTGVFLEINGLDRRVDQIKAKSGEFAMAGWPESGGDVERVLAEFGASDAGGEMTSGPAALTLIAVLYQGLEQVPAAELKSLRYDVAQQQLSARIGFTDFVGIDALSRALQTEGLIINSGDARQSGSQVLGEIEIGAAR